MNSTSIRSCCLAMTAAVGLALGLTGCHHEKPPGPGEHVVIYDDKGFKHEGMYDDHHAWHGGYKDDHSEFRDDPQDWHPEGDR